MNHWRPKANREEILDLPAQRPARQSILWLVLALLLVAISLSGCDIAGLPQPLPPTATPQAASPLTTILPTATVGATATFIPVPTSTLAEPVATSEPTDDPTPTPDIRLTAAPTIRLWLATVTPIRPRPTLTVNAQPTKTVRLVTATRNVPTVTSEPPPPIAWREVVRAAPGNKQIALTFDAGASAEPLPKILAALRERNLHVTMFFTGKFAEQNPDGLRQAVADGHEIGNHTYSHFDSKTLSDEELRTELARTEQIIRDITGVSTKPYWRPPLGSRNNHIQNVAVSQGYRSIYWTLDSLDSVGQLKTPEFIFNRVTNTPNINLDGAIVLQHFGSEPSAEALPRILDRLKEMGLRVVTISELLSSP